MSKKAKLPVKKTTSLRVLAAADIKHVKVTKAGEYETRRSKKGASHEVLETSNSVLAVPVKRWPKPPKAPLPPAHPIPEDTPVRPDDESWHPPIPLGATWGRITTSKACFMFPVEDLAEYRMLRGRVDFGKLRYGEDFVSMMPGEEGNITSWKDGRTTFAEGKDPESLKQKAKAKLEAAERLANPPAHVKAAFAANVAARVKAAAGPRADDVPGVRQCGVSKPKAGSSTGAVWEGCDALLNALKRCPTKPEVLAKLPALNPGTVGTQYAAWRRFYGHQVAK